MSVHRGGGSAPGGAGPGGLVSQDTLRQTPPPGETATVTSFGAPSGVATSSSSTLPHEFKTEMSVLT